ncbi:MAG: protein kinase domain-containing protein [Gemmataceae bacterium]
MLGRVFLRRYETIRRIGEGGMGSVYLAADKERDEPVVVKVMHEHIAGNPRFRARFSQEIASLASFQHPHSVAFLDASLDDPEGPCIVMEYVPGVSLDKLLARNSRFSPPRLHRIVTQLCDVLQAAHDQGIVHRDLKPANLMLIDPDTPREKLKVMDFGLAQLVDASAVEAQEQPREVEYAVGTPGYMSPEQVSGAATDHRSDLYSVGVILYQLLSGRMPFSGSTPMEILLAQATDDPPTFASLGLGEQVPATVESLIRSCLAIDPAARPQGARDIAELYQIALLHEQGEGEFRSLAPNEPSPAPADLSGNNSGAAELVEHIEAWMPEQIALYKLQAFADAVDGQIVESLRGLIRIRIRDGARPLRSGFFSWLGWGGWRKRGSNQIFIELHMRKKDEKQANLLQIAVVIRPEDTQLLQLAAWEDYCQDIQTTLRAYLMSQS